MTKSISEKEIWQLIGYIEISQARKKAIKAIGNETYNFSKTSFYFNGFC